MKRIILVVMMIMSIITMADTKRNKKTYFKKYDKTITEITSNVLGLGSAAGTASVGYLAAGSTGLSGSAAVASGLAVLGGGSMALGIVVGGGIVYIAGVSVKEGSKYLINKYKEKKYRNKKNSINKFGKKIYIY